MMYRLQLLISGICLVFGTNILEAQITFPGTPPSAKSLSGIGQSYPAVALPAVDLSKVLADDKETPDQNRFSVPVFTQISLETQGEWITLVNGDRLWRCGIQAADAKALLLIFDVLDLPETAALYAYSADRKQVLGAYTRASCLPNGRFLIGPIEGASCVLELLEPKAVKNQSKLEIKRVDYVYNKQALNNMEFDFGSALACNVNINCPAGSNWQTQKRGVARILMVFQNGSGWCSGSLVANTSNTYEPYFLTAHHCQLIGTNPDFPVWRFDFDYESTDCSNPAAEPGRNSVLGCERLAFRSNNDFMLLRLSPIPGNYNVYFNGWNRDTVSTQANSAFVHHPIGDIKKISVDNDPATIYNGTLNWTGIFGISQPNTHWKVVPDVGIFQPGSSGCPLFDPQKRIIGQLHGGAANTQNPCIILGAYFGRFNQSWADGSSADTRLKDWLDPSNTGALTQNGYARPVVVGYNISGNIKTHWDAPMKGVKVALTGATSMTTQTDSLGNFIFFNVPSGGTYTLTPSRDTNVLNGVSTSDLVLISKHILTIEPLNSPWKILSADINKSNSITTFDIVEARKTILGIYTEYPALPSWRFFPAATSFSNPDNPFASGLPQSSITIMNLQGNSANNNFKGIKVGDVNNTADPKG